MNRELQDFTIQDFSSLHRYRTEIPNIVDDLNLDPYEFRLYFVIKRIAGEKGTCFASNAELCRRSGMKITKLNEVKKRLSLPRSDLNGKSLITLTERKKSSGEPDTTLMIINDIWPENMIKYSIGGGMSPDDRRMSPDDRRMSPNDRKEEPYKKEPYKKEYSGKPSVPSSPAAKEISSLLQEELNKQKPDRSQTTESQIKKYIQPLVNRSKIEEIKKVIDWVFNSSSQKAEFWRTVIQGPQSLYNNFDKIVVQMTAKNSKEKEKEKESEKTNVIEENKKWAQKTIGNIRFESKDRRMILRDTLVEIVNGRSIEPLGYSENGFKEIITNKLRTWGLLE